MTDQPSPPLSHAPTRQDFVRHLINEGYGPRNAYEFAVIAERAGIVWHQEPQRPSIVAEIHDPTGARQVVAALEERVKDEIRKLIQEEISAFDRQSITPRLKNVDLRTESAIESADQGHRRLQTHDTRITSIENRENSYVQAIGELSARISRELGEDDPNDECDTVVERLDDLETRIQSLDRRVGDEIFRLRTTASSDGLMERILALEAASNVNVLQRVARVESEWQIEGQKLAADRRQLREFVVDTVSRTDDELASIKSLIDAAPVQLRGRVDTMWRRLYESFDEGDATEFGLLELVRRLDADVALLRDAAVLPPPQGANQVDPNWNADDELVKAMHDQYRAELQTLESATEPAVEWPDPTPEMLESSVFEAVWQVIRTWFISTPTADSYTVSSAATGRHVRAILDAINGKRDDLVRRLGQKCEHLRQTREALRAACTELGADSQWSDETSLADVVSKVLMPAVRKPRSTTDELIQALRGFSGPEIWHAMGIVRQVEVPVGNRICGVSPASLWNGSTVEAQDDLLDYLWRNHSGRVGKAAAKHGIFCGEAASGTGRRPLKPAHDDLAYALGRAYRVINSLGREFKGLEARESFDVAAEMETIRLALGNNWRDWLRPRSQQSASIPDIAPACGDPNVDDGAF